MGISSYLKGASNRACGNQIPENRNINGEQRAHFSTQAGLLRVLIRYMQTPEDKLKDTKLAELEFDF